MEIEMEEIIVDEEVEIGDIELDVEKIYPELEDLEVTPSGIEQEFKSKNYYGYNEIKVKKVESEELNITPNEESQQFIGLYGTVNIDKIPDEYVSGVDLLNNLINRSITEIKINESITEIGDYVFAGCSNLSSIIIPNTVTSIGISAFLRCSSLKNIELPNKITRLETNVFQYCTDLTEIVIPEKVVNIASYVFDGCTNLKDVQIPDGVTVINSYTFRACTSIEEIKIPKDINTLGNNLFYGCKNLKTINIPSSVRTIYATTFSGCTALENVNIEEGFGSVLSGGNSINLSASTLYSVETIVSWLEALADRTGQTAYAFTIGATNLEKLTDEQKAIATNKNWNLA